ncbi:MAG: hypothetical protein ACLVCW_03430 [Campylobacter sp.]
MRQAAQEAKILRYKIFAPRNFKIYRQSTGVLKFCRYEILKFHVLKFRRVEFQNLACADKILRNFIGAMSYELQS